jgi:hypothetical protein
MPSVQELLGIFVAVIVIWFILKMARLAIRMIFFIISVLVLIGVLYFVFVR